MAIHQNDEYVPEDGNEGSMKQGSRAKMAEQECRETENRLKELHETLVTELRLAEQAASYCRSEADWHDNRADALRSFLHINGQMGPAVARTASGPSRWEATGQGKRDPNATSDNIPAGII